MIKLNIALFGGRGASSLGTKGKDGMLKAYNKIKSEQLDVSYMSGYPVKLKSEFETFLDMKNNKVEYGYLIDKNGKVVAGAKGNKNSVGVAYSDNQEGMTLTHNHPSKYGGTFSGADISYLTTAKLKQIRAVAKEGTYKMTATKHANPVAFNKALAKDINKLNIKALKNQLKVKKGNLTKSQYKIHQRKAYVDTIDDWYKKNASKYGYEYTFKANKDFKI